MLRIGTRGSQLARTQSGHVVDALQKLDPSLSVETVVIATDDAGTADKSRFVGAIEQQLIDQEIDLAVHSAKDLPGEATPGLMIIAVPKRQNPSDVLLGAESLDELREGATVGTSSLRRAAQLRAARPDLKIAPLRGNIDTRLGKLATDEYDAIVLAAAGLNRLRAGADLPSCVLGFVTAPGQGCLALQARDVDLTTTTVVGPLSHRGSQLELTAERAVAMGLSATCNTPIGVNSRIAHEADGDRITISAWLGLPDGSEQIADEISGPATEAKLLGHLLAQRVRSAGGEELLAAAEEMAA